MRRFPQPVTLILLSLGCSSNITTNNLVEDDAGTSTGGSSNATTNSIGGSSATAGATSRSGGAGPIGGSSSAGTSNSAGTSSTGTAGSPEIGGTSAGGIASAGGVSPGGAPTATGGTATSGTTAVTAGNASTGGVVGNGGASATGAATATGGASVGTGGGTAKGGATATGGTSATGGASAKGGATGTGGAAVTGGATATATGGTVTTGGTTVGTGGATGCTGACCSNADCPGTCQMCSASKTCVAVTNADDPNGRCTGTCDASGTCKSKKGQACTTVSSGCVSGTVCSPEGLCCDKACTGSCEACDLSGALGTCTTLASGAVPHTGHSACTATSAECAGKCGGTSAACVYTTVSCGSASCSGSTYTPVGACSNGACVAGTARSCATNEACSGGACACIAPNQTCSGACANLSTDAANCGSCGHSCGTGGACTSGLCEPIVMASGLGGYSFVFGVDASYVYYNNCSDYYTCTPLRIAIGAVGGTGTTLTTLTASGIGVIGSTLLLFQNQVANFLCGVGSTCAVTAATRLGNGIFAGFKSPAPSYFALSDYSNTTTEFTTWYTTANAVQSTFYWSHTGNLGNFAQVGNSVYFSDSDASGTTYSIWGTVGFPASTTLQLAGGITYYPGVVDANSKSLIFQNGSTKYLYRVPLPGGLGTAAPQNIVGATGTKFVTEDANGIYWIDTTGNLNRCTAPTCSGNTVMLTGQILGSYFSANSSLGALYQDTGFLYWINGFGQLMKLAK